MTVDPRAERMAATLVRLANEALAQCRPDCDHGNRWTDLPGHEDMLLEAELAHAQGGDDRPALRAAAIGIAERALFG